jgi:hypothetical protein
MAALREPIFGESRARSELPPRDGNTSPEFRAAAERLIAPSATMAPVERLELYHRQYWYRLLDSIAEDFPALRRLLGDAAFWSLLEAYLEAAPPSSFTLRHLGGGLADFIAAHPSVVVHPTHAEDLARLEYALCLAFEAGARPPIDPSELGRGRLALQPHVLHLALRTPAEVLWRRASSGRRLGALRARTRHAARFVAVFRDGDELRVERISKLAHAILQALERSCELAPALALLEAEPGLVRPRDAAHVNTWFATWVSRGWLTRPTSAQQRAQTNGTPP